MKESGQTLIEVLAALSAAVVVIAAITVASISSLNNAEFSRNQNLATHYAQEGMEVVRKMRDLSIASVSASLLPDGFTYCMASGCNYITNDNQDSNYTQCGPQQSGSCNQNVGVFVRKINLNYSASECDYVEVTSTVSWNDGKCTDVSKPYCHQVVLTSCLSNFTVVPTP